MFIPATISKTTDGITWAPVDNVDYYVVHRRSPQTGEQFNPDDPSTQIARVTDTYFVTPDGDYDWQVFGVVAPLQPIPVTAERLSETEGSLSFNMPTDAPHGLTVVRALGKYAATEPPNEAVTVSTNVTSSPYIDATLNNAGEYTYWVARTSDVVPEPPPADVNSPGSRIVTATIPTYVPSGDLYPFTILYPLSSSEVGLEGAAVDKATLTVVPNSVTVHATGRNDNNVVTNYDTATGTKADPFFINRHKIEGELLLDGPFHTHIANSWITGNSHFAVRAINGASFYMANSEVGSESIVPSTGFYGADIQVLKTYVHHVGDAAKCFGTQLYQECYIANLAQRWSSSTNEYIHTDGWQFNDGASGTLTILRCWNDTGAVRVGGPNDGQYNGGNANLQMKPDDNERMEILIEDSYFAAGNYGLQFLDHFCNPESTMTARRLVMKGNKEGNTWTVGTAISTGLSSRSSGNGNRILIREQVFHEDGTQLY